MSAAVAALKSIWGALTLGHCTRAVLGLAALLEAANRVLAALDVTLDRLQAIQQKIRRLRAGGGEGGGLL
ncbi:hypothetical protein CALCODRAFT_487737 [Calocera cornea HHB12733]|uniref:Uncharacterized protein n=1 Tax=Calocera cornea HHB12733 TaxID=1353952 RepID=A0A165CYG2_9BASI|nr:hypothetical protein CALCODRAFT_487737 [Calocera cornea HHB12733]